MIKVSNEPDYIKIYTRMWCEFNQIPIRCRPLFMALVSRMTYCNANDLNHSQIIQTGSIFREAIQEELGIQRSQYQSLLRDLVKCGAIKKIANHRGIYQVNPSYAGKGEWKYNPRLDRGGVEDLKAIFSMRDHEVDVSIVWADDGQDSKFNDTYRHGLNVSADDNTILKTKHISPNGGGVNE